MDNEPALDASKDAIVVIALGRRSMQTRDDMSKCNGVATTPAERSALTQCGLNPSGSADEAEACRCNLNRNVFRLIGMGHSGGTIRPPLWGQANERKQRLILPLQRNPLIHMTR